MGMRRARGNDGGEKNGGRMTVWQLSQLYFLRREIAGDERRLANLRYEGGSAESERELRAAIERKRDRCVRERLRLEEWISGVEDSLVRQILTHRFVDGCTWLQVAMRIGGGNTEDSVKKICYRYIDGQAKDGKSGR